jgi:hypothetical protein
VLFFAYRFTTSFGSVARCPLVARDFLCLLCLLRRLASLVVRARAGEQRSNTNLLYLFDWTLVERGFLDLLTHFASKSFYGVKFFARPALFRSAVR